MLKDLPADLMRELEAVTAKAMFDEPAFAATEAGRHEIYVHLVHRLTEFRNNVMPWLGKHMTLDGARVLEIGAGTGSSVVALAESGAEVDAIDIMDNHLTVARTRVAMHGLQARIVACNAVDFPFAWGDYDLILLSATLEHMTLSERLSFLETAWKHLKARGLLGIYETPNRLWFRDDHTSQLPFFHWLTDEMAIAYARKSPRADFASSQLDVTRLARWGRGASFHEIDLSIGLDNCSVEQSLHQFLCDAHPHYREAWDASLGKRYFELLGEIQPGLECAWREEMLNVLLRKK